MRALLDVNVLIALLDSDHVHHRRALQWFTDHADAGWASCSLTQNGCLRIVAQPGYPNHPGVAAIMRRLSRFVSTAVHSFWSDDVSLLDASRIDSRHLLGHRQITDVYLLALATHHGGRLVTFDRNVPLAAVPAATEHNLSTI